MEPRGDGRATEQGREGNGQSPGLAVARRLPNVELLAAGLGLAEACSATQAPVAANDAPSAATEDVRDGEGPVSGWRAWFGAVVRETLDSTGTFRT